MHKRIISVVILTISVSTQTVFCQADDVKQLIHDKVEHYSVNSPRGEKWEAAKKEFAKYDQNVLAEQLIAELDTDRGNVDDNRLRDHGVEKIYRALNLPLALVCTELRKTQTPQRKASLIGILWGANTPEVTTTLCQQVIDSRPAVEFDGDAEMPTRPQRVCDVACNTLDHNLNPKSQGKKIGWYSSDQERNEIIVEVLKELHLSVPE